MTLGSRAAGREVPCKCATDPDAQAPLGLTAGDITVCITRSLERRGSRKETPFGGWISHPTHPRRAAARPVPGVDEPQRGRRDVEPIRCRRAPHPWGAHRLDPRAEIVLEKGETQPFDPFDRFAQFEVSTGRTLEELLDTFAALRVENLQALRDLRLEPSDYERAGHHPEFAVASPCGSSCRLGSSTTLATSDRSRGSWPGSTRRPSAPGGPTFRCWTQGDSGKTGRGDPEW